jgi:hypothetical protein
MRKLSFAIGLAFFFALGCARGQGLNTAQACTGLADDVSRLSCYDAVTSLAYGQYRLTLENGQVWRTTEQDLALEFKANDMVTITRRVLGGYEISLAGRNASVNATRMK